MPCVRTVVDPERKQFICVIHVGHRDAFHLRSRQDLAKDFGSEIDLLDWMAAQVAHVAKMRPL